MQGTSSDSSKLLYHCTGMKIMLIVKFQVYEWRWCHLFILCVQYYTSKTAERVMAISYCTCKNLARTMPRPLVRNILRYHSFYMIHADTNDTFVLFSSNIISHKIVLKSPVSTRPSFLSLEKISHTTMLSYFDFLSFFF